MEERILSLLDEYGWMTEKEIRKALWKSRRDSTSTKLQHRFRVKSAISYLLREQYIIERKMYSTSGKTEYVSNTGFTI